MRGARVIRAVEAASTSTAASTVLQTGHAAKLAIPENSTVFSAIQPTGVFHIGNYLGAVRSWVDIAEQAPASAKMYFAVADLHALTVPKPAASLRTWRQQALASIIAAGIDPDRCVVYHQSAVPAHSQLFWLLSTVTGMGYLNRMVQWKSKSNVSERVSIDNIESDEALSKLQLGLFAYPALQAADILLHKADLVPVGEDQSQHLELTRHITQVFNAHFSPPDSAPIFPVPRTLFAPYKKILSLRDTSKKMSKSDPIQGACLFITDSPDQIRDKIKRAVTDSVQGPITYDPVARPGVSNLLLMASGLLNTEPQLLLDSQLSHVSNHAQLKSAVADILIDTLEPVRRRYEALSSDSGYLDEIAKRGADKASQTAAKTMDEVNRLVGL